MVEYWQRFVSWVSDSVTLPQDSESLRIRKTTLVVVTIILIPVNSIWTVSLFALNLRSAALINLAQGVLAATAAYYLFRTRNFMVFMNFFLGVTFLYIYTLQSSLGGIIQSGVLISGGLLTAMAAAMLLGRRMAIFWAAVNVAGFTFVLAFEGPIRLTGPTLPPGFSPINGFFNAVWTSFLAMMLTLYLVKQLEIAHDRADELLFNVLPRPVAHRLKENPGTIADAHDHASILFADIVGFTTLSNLLSPNEMIHLLNRVYTHFDRLVEHYGVEKIRTIGDNYMVAAGVPDPRPDHAQALANLALDMLAYCKTLEIDNGPKLQFRIGINSGPLIAGVIGSRRYQYDIWGDAVNTASRMESHGLPGKAQVARDTYELLNREFVLVPRGGLEVKGKGEMETWWLTGRR